jgi:hypothetical protein
MEGTLVKEEWRFTSMENGALFVTIFGIEMMPRLCAPNYSVAKL